MKYTLCRLDDIKDNEVKSFSIKAGSRMIALFIIRKGDQIYGYINRCPHTGANLDWISGQFLDSSEKFIQCSTHGAKFRITDGYCLYGPCVGDHLQPIDIDINKGELIIKQNESNRWLLPGNSSSISNTNY